MKFDEFHAGQSIDAGSVTIAEEQIVRFALEFDPQWFHVDADMQGWLSHAFDEESTSWLVW